MIKSLKAIIDGTSRAIKWKWGGRLRNPSILKLGIEGLRSLPPHFTDATVNKTLKSGMSTARSHK